MSRTFPDKTRPIAYFIQKAIVSAEGGNYEEAAFYWYAHYAGRGQIFSAFDEYGYGSAERMAKVSGPMFFCEKFLRRHGFNETHHRATDICKTALINGLKNGWPKQPSKISFLEKQAIEFIKKFFNKEA